MGGQELLEGRQGGGGFGKVVEPELEKSSLFEDFRGLFDHLRRRGAGDGDAQFADARAEEVGGDVIGCRHACSRGMVTPKWPQCNSLPVHFR
jgi:hypothetical protein